MLRLASLVILLFSAPGLQATGSIDAATGAASDKADCAAAPADVAVAGARGYASDAPPKVAPPAATGPTRAVNGPGVGGTRWHRLLPGMFR